MKPGNVHTLLRSRQS